MKSQKLKKSVQAILLLLLSVSVIQPASAQLPVSDEGETTGVIYAKPIKKSTVVRAGASSDARVIDQISSNTILVSVSSEGQFEKVEPVAGSDLSWEEGYIHSDQIDVGIDLPWRATYGVFGSLASITSRESVLMVNDVPVVPNPFGQPGTGGMLSLGLTLGGGYFIPVEDTGFKVRLDGQYSIMQGNDQAQNVDSTNFSMIRVGVGGSVIHRITSKLDLSVGAVAGGGPVRNKLSLVNGQTVTGRAWYGTAELFAGLGYGRNYTSGVKLAARLEGGYRIGTKISDWSYDFERNSSSAVSLESDGNPFSIGGPFLRLVIGI